MNITQKHKDLYDLAKLEQLADKFKLKDANLKKKIDDEKAKVKNNG